MMPLANDGGTEGGGRALASNTFPAVVSRLSLSLLLVFALAVAASVALVQHYGGEEFFVQLASGFVAALAAFVLALTWERDREATRAVESAKRVTEEQVIEVSRRLRTVREELLENLKSFEDVQALLDPPHTEYGTPLAAFQRVFRAWAFVNPHLLAGAWTASAASLAELLADYELTARISRTYDRIEELRWRLRMRAETLDIPEWRAPGSVRKQLFDLKTSILEEILGDLVGQLIPETKDLLERIDAEIANPSVRFGGIVQRVTMGGAIAGGATIETEVIRADEESS
jgi:hypothetical protein